MLCSQMAVVGAIWLWKQVVRLVEEAGEEIAQSEFRSTWGGVFRCEAEHGQLDGGCGRSGPADDPISVPKTPPR
jgi:hypothetical protein